MYQNKQGFSLPFTPDKVTVVTISGWLNSQFLVGRYRPGCWPTLGIGGCCCGCWGMALSAGQLLRSVDMSGDAVLEADSVVQSVWDCATEASKIALITSHSTGTRTWCRLHLVLGCFGFLGGCCLLGLFKPLLIFRSICRDHP